MKKQVETTWASERMANAVLRERINDVASEVVRVAVALEGLNSPINSLVAGKTASAQALTDDAALAAKAGRSRCPSALDNGDGTEQRAHSPHPRAAPALRAHDRPRLDGTDGDRHELAA